MAYAPKTLEEISQKLRAAFNAEIPGADAFIWPNNLYVAGKVFAGLLRSAYLQIFNLHQERFISTCSPDTLVRKAVDMGQSQQSATFANGNVIVTGDDGTLIPATTRIFRGDQFAFDTVADATIDGITVIVGVVAEEVGKLGNTPGGATLTPEAPIDGVTSFVVDSKGLSGGLDLESTESLRARLLDLKRNPPQGGTPGEFIRWSKEKLGVTRSFFFRATPMAGHVTLVFMMDDLYTDGIPAAGEVSDMQTLLETRAPGSIEIHALAPTRVPVPVVITSLVPNDGATQTAVLAELQAVFKRKSVPGSVRADFTFSRSWIAEAIPNATGEESNAFSDPADDVTVSVLTDGTPEIAVLGAVTFPA